MIIISLKSICIVLAMIAGYMCDPIIIVISLLITLNLKFNKLLVCSINGISMAILQTFTYTMISHKPINPIYIGVSFLAGIVWCIIIILIQKLFNTFRKIK